MLPKVLEIERHQLADYARVDYAITKAEDEIAALEELWLGPNELRREASVVRDRTVLAVREVRNNMAKRAITAKSMQGPLVESLRQRSRFAVVDSVDASLRALCNVLANLWDSEDGPITNDRGLPPQRVWPKPQLFQCGSFVFALRDRVINAGVIGQLVSLNLKHFW